MPQFNILRVCVLIVTTDLSGNGVYINGNLWRKCDNLQVALFELGMMFRKKMVIVDSWEFFQMPSFEKFPDTLHQLIEQYPSSGITPYEGEKSHGVLPGQPQRNPDKPHVKWFVWFDDKNQVVCIADRVWTEAHLRSKVDDSNWKPGEAYYRTHEFVKEIAMGAGGNRCVEFSVDRFRTREEILMKYPKSPNYVK